MKRQLTALVLVLAMVIGILPMAAFANDETPASVSEMENSQVDLITPGVGDGAEAESDIVTNNMDNVENLGDSSSEVPADDAAPLDFTADATPHFCSDTDGDCLCDVCGIEYHQHIETERDAEGHWGCCIFCHKLVTEKVSHTDTDGNGKCDQCGYQVGTCIEHNWSEWHYDQFYHRRYCLNGCSTSESSAHSMVNGVCSVCGYVPCADGHSFSGGYFDKSSENFMHTCDICGHIEVCGDADGNCACDTCGTELHHFITVAIDSQNHHEVCEKCGLAPYEPHPHSGYESDGICDDCHYNVREDTPECPHKNIDSLSDYEGHVIFCSSCFTALKEKEPHTMQDGKCMVCGFTPCTEHTYPDYPTEYRTHTCTKCWMQGNCVDANHDCVCDICGMETHPNYTYETTEALHCRFCSDCGQVCDLGAGVHEDWNGDGQCDECGYQIKPEVKPEPDPDPVPDPDPDTPEVSKPEKGESTGSSVTTWPVKTILSKYRTLHDQNSDLYGWITISGTKVDYPVMYAPGNPEKYLNLDFDRNSSSSGTPFLKDECDLGRDIVVIYASNPEDGSMFHGLLSYAEEAFWRENTEILFDTLYEKGTYEIVAAFFTEEYREDSADFQIDDILHVRNSKEYKEAISYIHEKAMYDTDIAVNYGDGLLTLITDAGGSEGGRFVVVAKRK